MEPAASLNQEASTTGTGTGTGTSSSAPISRLVHPYPTHTHTHTHPAAPPSNGIENLNPSRNPYHSPRVGGGGLLGPPATTPNGTPITYHSPNIPPPLVPNLSPPTLGLLNSPSGSMNGNTMSGRGTPPMTLNSFPLTPTSLSTTTALYYNSNPTIQHAVQTALTHYKQKIMNSTTIEKTYTADQLRHVLLNERHATKSMVAELAAYKSMAVVTQAEAEVVEEGRINCLMRKLDGVVKEKGRIVLELEREEEMLTNTLQKKLNQVRREKADLERQIEREHEFNLELKAQLDAAGGDKSVVPNDRQTDESEEEEEEEQGGDQFGNRTSHTTSTTRHGRVQQGRGSNSIAGVDRITSRFQSTLEPFHDE